MKKFLKYLFAFTGFTVILIVLSIVCLGVLLPSDVAPRARDFYRYAELFEDKIRYRVTDGVGPNIILLHGFGGNLKSWDPLSSYLKCGRLISLDIIGFGGSDRPRIKYDLETHRRYLIKFMDVLKIERAVLVGSSMGASIAVWTASNSHERVLALILFAPSGYPGSMKHKWPAHMLYKPGILNRVARQFVESSLYEILFPDSLGRQALCVTASYDNSFAEALYRINQPTMLFWSSGDRRVPLSFSKAYRDNIPQMDFIELPYAAGHGGAKYAPHDTATQICSFLEKHK